MEFKIDEYIYFTDKLNGFNKPKVYQVIHIFDSYYAIKSLPIKTSDIGHAWYLRDKKEIHEGSVSLGFDTQAIELLYL